VSQYQKGKTNLDLLEQEIVMYSYTHTKLFYCSSGICLGPPGWAGTNQENQSGFTGARDSELQWHLLGYMQVCTSFQTTMPTSHHSVFTGRMPFLPPNQQRQSTEGICIANPRKNHATGNAIVATATLTSCQGCSLAWSHCEITVIF